MVKARTVLEGDSMTGDAQAYERGYIMTICMSDQCDERISLTYSREGFSAAAFAETGRSGCLETFARCPWAAALGLPVVSCALPILGAWPGLGLVPVSHWL